MAKKKMNGIYKQAIPEIKRWMSLWKLFLLYGMLIKKILKTYPIGKE